MKINKTDLVAEAIYQTKNSEIIKVYLSNNGNSVITIRTNGVITVKTGTKMTIQFPWGTEIASVTM